MSVTLTLVTAFAAGLLVAVVTTPVGVSGAVFLLPIQDSVLHVPNPAVTPTNLLYNVIATPGALVRYGRQASLSSPLTKTLLVGAAPGVVVGAIVRVFVIPGPGVFRLVVASVLLPLGLWLCMRTIAGRRTTEAGATHLSRAYIAVLALGVGVVGGIYGIGGGSLLSPILVGRGMSPRTVAPAALMTTFVTSVIGSLAYAFLAEMNPAEHIAPRWGIGIIAGVGGLLGGYLGAALQPRVPECGLRVVLGVLAIATGVLYIWRVAA